MYGGACFIIVSLGIFVLYMLYKNKTKPYSYTILHFLFNFDKMKEKWVLTSFTKQRTFAPSSLLHQSNFYPYLQSLRSHADRRPILKFMSSIVFLVRKCEFVWEWFRVTFLQQPQMLYRQWWEYWYKDSICCSNRVSWTLQVVSKFV